MSPLNVTLLSTLGVVTGILTLVWIASVKLRDASIIDPCWGLGFVLIAWQSALINGFTDSRTILLVTLITIWGTRLSAFLLYRNHGHGEDRRYTVMREHHGLRFWWVSLFTVFLLQAILLWLIAWPFQVAMARRHSPGWNWLDAIGLVVWTAGFLFEAVGDWQLARFKSDPANANRVMDRGLWRYTRHPNYFGDCCVWWGIYLIAATGGASWTIASPLLMTVLLLKVSGVSLLESTIIDRRPDYAQYQAQTSAFFPWPPNIPVSQVPT